MSIANDGFIAPRPPGTVTPNVRTGTLLGERNTSANQSAVVQTKPPRGSCLEMKNKQIKNIIKILDRKRLNYLYLIF